MTHQNNAGYFHNFGFEPPKGYQWLLEQRLVGFSPFSALQPWYYLEGDQIFKVNERWPKGPYNGALVAFARRQDNDDIACFHVEKGDIKAVVVINGWTGSGYDVLQRYDSFWAWLKSVVDDIAEWVENSV
jgi:hypothetical protein